MQKKVSKITVLPMPLADVEYDHEFPINVERWRVQLRDAAAGLRIADKTGNVTAAYALEASALAIGSTKTNVANDAVDIFAGPDINTVAADAVGIILAGDDIPQNKYGAYRLQAGDDSTIDLVEANDNVTGYDSAIEAIADLPDLVAGHASLGTVTIINTAAAFEPGTTLLDAAGVTAVYTDAPIVATSDHPFWTMFAAGTWSEEDILHLKGEDVQKGPKYYFSSSSADQYLEIMYWTGHERSS